MKMLLHDIFFFFLYLFVKSFWLRYLIYAGRVTAMQIAYCDAAIEEEEKEEKNLYIEQCVIVQQQKKKKQFH